MRSSGELENLDKDRPTRISALVASFHQRNLFPSMVVIVLLCRGGYAEVNTGVP